MILFSSAQRSLLRNCIQLMRLNKPIGILLLLWPTLWTLWLSYEGTPPLDILIIFIIGTVLTRSAGCVLNDIADRHFDAHVSRTHHRVLAQGKWPVKYAYVLSLLLLAGAGSLLFFLPIQVIPWCLVAVVLSVSYPYTKRYFHMPQLYLGITFGVAIPIATLAAQKPLSLTTLGLVLSTVAWSLTYDTQYALADRADDLKIGIKSAAITLRSYDVLAIMLSLMATVLLLLWVGHLHALAAPFYYVLIGSASIFGCIQYALIRHRDPQRCFRAFLQHAYFGAAVWIALLLGI